MCKEIRIGCNTHDILNYLAIIKLELNKRNKEGGHCDLTKIEHQFNKICECMDAIARGEDCIKE